MTFHRHPIFKIFTFFLFFFFLNFYTSLYNLLQLLIHRSIRQQIQWIRSQNQSLLFYNLKSNSLLIALDDSLIEPPAEILPKLSNIGTKFSFKLYGHKNKGKKEKKKRNPANETYKANRVTKSSGKTNKVNEKAKLKI